MDPYSKISPPWGRIAWSLSVLSGPEWTGYYPFHLCGFWVLVMMIGPFSLCGNVTLLASVSSLNKIFCHVYWVVLSPLPCLFLWGRLLFTGSRLDQMVPFGGPHICIQPDAFIGASPSLASMWPGPYRI